LQDSKYSPSIRQPSLAIDDRSNHGEKGAHRCARRF
jgi:hypothetical protein